MSLFNVECRDQKGTYLIWLLDLTTSWTSTCLLSESISIILRVILNSFTDFLSSRTKSVGHMQVS